MKNTKLSITSNIRATLLGLVNVRIRAYKEIIARGKTIPRYGQKLQSINVINHKLEIASNWGLDGHARTVVRLRDHINEILPSRSSLSKRDINLRRKVCDMITYCENQSKGAVTVQLSTLNQSKYAS